MRRTILFILGTQPEAIKLCPLLLQLRSFPALHATKVCVTAQQRGMLDQTLTAFGVKPDYDLNVIRPGQTLFQSTARIIQALERPFAESKPDLAVVQGDTATTLCGALAAFYSGVPVAHIGAGLRTGDLGRPFPEELNHVLTTRMAALHFAATSSAGENLRCEGITKNVWITGNTGIDAVLHVRDRLERGQLTAPSIGSALGFLRPGKRLILVTAHRRESFGEGFRRICKALIAIADRKDVHIIYLIHPSPNVQTMIKDSLRAHPNITLTEPMYYVPFIELMRRSYLILTDSGGIQEEGPSLGKPVLVLGEKSERPEAVEAGTVKLVGTDVASIVHETTTLLDYAEEYHRISRIHNPYGDGHASERIEAALLDYWKTAG